ncbi:MAG: glycosyltransferase [Planctomycetota bacterium]|nr:glycosyltransferase [Planctomycetota bacterium]MDP6837340.1 glycosyltransferase [Planctomycetota bacterium]
MGRPVSVVIPTLGDVDLLETALGPLLEELDARDQEDEVIVVDDTGSGELVEPLAQRHGRLRVIARPDNGGFAEALLVGVRCSKHPRVFALNPDVRVRSGFLEPLLHSLEDPDVFAVTPRVLLNGDGRQRESLSGLVLVDGVVRVTQRPDDGLGCVPRPVPFAVGGAWLFRRDEFLAVEGYDSLFKPFYWEDLSLCFAAWRAGMQVLEQPESVVEHHHRGTIGKCVPENVRLAAIEKNRLLFQWKYMDDPEVLAASLATLRRRALETGLSGSGRRELEWLVLALDQADEVLAARASLAPGERSFAEVVAESGG